MPSIRLNRQVTEEAKTSGLNPNPNWMLNPQFPSSFEPNYYPTESYSQAVVSVKTPDCKLATFCRNKLWVGRKKLNWWTNNCFRGQDRSRHAHNLSNVKYMSLSTEAEMKVKMGFCTDLWWINQQVALLAPRLSWLARVMVGEKSEILHAATSSRIIHSTYICICPSLKMYLSKLQMYLSNMHTALV